MNTQKLNHKNIVLPQLPDHSEHRKLQNIMITTCLGLSLLCAISMIILTL